MTNLFLNADCMCPKVGLPSYPDNHFDLAIVDPPYGIKESSYRVNRPKSTAAPKKEYHVALWSQEKPSELYFKELFRVSKNQIVWGGNYFTDNLPQSRVWLIWDKVAQFARQVADVEMAWTSFSGSSKLIRFQWCGMLQGDMSNKENRIHPTQKPVKLYAKCLSLYAQPNDLILDTHVGSASSLIACESMGFNYVGYELDPDYYAAAKNRMAKGIQLQML